MDKVEARSRVWLFGVAVAGVAFAVSANTLLNGFIWDDSIILDRQLPVFQTVGSVLVPPAGIPQFAPDYYRPLVVATYLVDHAIGGRNPFWYHLSVLLAHCLAAVGVFALARQLVMLSPDTLADPEWAGLFAGLLFAVHPIHTEAVAWAAGRADVLATAFSALAAAAHLAGRRDYRWAFVAGLSLWLALAAKEAAVALLLLLPLMDWLAPAALPVPAVGAARGDRAARRRRSAPKVSTSAPPGLLARYAPLALAVAVYGALRLAALGPVRPEQVGHGIPRLSAILAALAVYFGKLLAPVSLNAYITTLPDGMLAPSIAVVIVVALTTLAVWAVPRRVPLVTVAVAWIAIGIVPPLAILVKIPEAPVAERYLYLPSVGLCLVFGWLVARGLRAGREGLRVPAMIAVAGLLIGGAIGSVERNAVWRSDLSLWSDTVEKSPDSGMPWRSLAMSLAAAGRVDEAVATYETALGKHNPENGRLTIYNNLGSIALNRGDIEAAEKYYRSALEIQPDADLLYNMGVIHLARARKAEDAGDLAQRDAHGEQARAFLERAEKANPHDPEIQAALGQVLLYRGERAAARQRFERALAMGLRGVTAEQVRARLVEWDGAASHPSGRKALEGDPDGRP